MRNHALLSGIASGIGEPSFDSLCQESSSRATEVCTFLNYAEGNENSPCIQAAPGTYKATIMAEVCATIKTNLPCYAHPDCEW